MAVIARDGPIFKFAELAAAEHVPPLPISGDKWRGMQTANRRIFKVGPHKKDFDLFDKTRLRRFNAPGAYQRWVTSYEAGKGPPVTLPLFRPSPASVARTERDSKEDQYYRAKISDFGNKALSYLSLISSSSTGALVISDRYNDVNYNGQVPPRAKESAAKAFCQLKGFARVLPNEGVLALALAIQESGFSPDAFAPRYAARGLFQVTAVVRYAVAAALTNREDFGDETQGEWDVVGDALESGIFDLGLSRSMAIHHYLLGITAGMVMATKIINNKGAKVSTLTSYTVGSPSTKAYALNYVKGISYLMDGVTRFYNLVPLLFRNQSSKKDRLFDVIPRDEYSLEVGSLANDARAYLYGNAVPSDARPLSVHPHTGLRK